MYDTLESPWAGTQLGCQLLAMNSIELESSDGCLPLNVFLKSLLDFLSIMNLAVLEGYKTKCYRLYVFLFMGKQVKTRIISERFLYIDPTSGCLETTLSVTQGTHHPLIGVSSPCICTCRTRTNTS